MEYELLNLLPFVVSRAFVLWWRKHECHENTNS